MHKIWDKSFEEYKALIIDKTEKADMRIDFEATIKESYSIIADFVPE